MDCVAYDSPLVLTSQKSRPLQKGQLRIRTRFAGINYAGIRYDSQSNHQIFLRAKESTKRNQSHRFLLVLKYLEKLLNATNAPLGVWEIVFIAFFLRTELLQRNVWWMNLVVFSFQKFTTLLII